MNNKFETYRRVAVFSELEEYCTHAKPTDYVEVTEWHNGEGFDVDVCTTNRAPQKFMLTFGEWKLLKKMVKSLDNLDIENV